jgi:hypothetical protein
MNFWQKSIFAYVMIYASGTSIGAPEYEIIKYSLSGALCAFAANDGFTEILNGIKKIFGFKIY